MLEKKYYTIKETADLLRVSESTIRNWIRNGMLKAQKVGKKWLIPREEIEKLLKLKPESK